MQITHGQWIAGVASREGDPAFWSVDPRTRKQRGEAFADATDGEIERASQAATSAFADFRDSGARSRADFLDAVAAELETDADGLTAVADAETALGPVRLRGELARTTGQLRAFSGLIREGSYVSAIIDHALPERQPTPRPDIRRMLVPIGPVAVFSASNFPFAFSVCGGDTASAWAAGCPVVVKGHPGHPETSEQTALAVHRAIERTGTPRGVFSLLQGASVRVGQGIVEHPAICAVGFTGSLRGGRALFDLAASRPVPIPVYAEMGSVNPVVILPSALATRSQSVVEGLAQSAMLGAGQFCTNPGIVLLLSTSESHTFINAYVEQLQSRQAGVLLNEAVLRSLSSAVTATATKPAVSVLTGGSALPDGGYCFENTAMRVSASDFISDPDLQREHFGPVTLIVVAADERELLRAVERLEPNLTATLFAEPDDPVAPRLFTLLTQRAGRVLWNGFPTGVEVVHAQQHGGPYPATTAPASTSVGLTAIHRWLRPVAFQNFPDALLPTALQESNPLAITRIVDGHFVCA